MNHDKHGAIDWVNVLSRKIRKRIKTFRKTTTNYQQLIMFNASLSVYKYIDIEHCCNCLQSLFKTRKFNGGPKCHSNEGIQTFVRYY